MHRAGFRRAAGLAAGGAGLGFAAVHAPKVPTAFHEAGHSVVAFHMDKAGIAVDEKTTGTIIAAQRALPLLRFATIEPRTTPKGVTYLGETKLTIRWRHMSRHVEWQEPLPSAHSSSGQGNGGCDPPILACDHT